MILQENIFFFYLSILFKKKTKLVIKIRKLTI